VDYAGAIAHIVPGSFVPDIGKMDEKPVVSNIPGTADASGATSFKDTVKQMLADVNTKLNVSDENARDLATGKTGDIEKVVTSVEEANLALQYTMAIRSKLLDAYSEISRLQV
jgi:flagellar hook-basal body complex protein FliE